MLEIRTDTGHRYGASIDSNQGTNRNHHDEGEEERCATANSRSGIPANGRYCKKHNRCKNDVGCLFRRATNFVIMKSAANLSIPMTTYTPVATLAPISQSPVRNDDPKMNGIERQAWPQNQRVAADGDVDSARSVNSSMRSPSIASGRLLGRTDSTNRQTKAGGELRLICSPSGFLSQPSCCEVFAPILAAPACRQPRRETVVWHGPRARASGRQWMS